MPQTNAAFLDDFRALQRRISHVGLFNSLAQTLLKITAPGVPDTYQGTELWDFSLVDPDNRRPVDYARRHRLLQELQARLAAAGNDRTALAQELLAHQGRRAHQALRHRAGPRLPPHAPRAVCRRGLPPGSGARGAARAYLWVRPPPGRPPAVVVVPRLMARLLAGRPCSAPRGGRVAGHHAAAAWHDAAADLAPCVDGRARPLRGGRWPRHADRRRGVGAFSSRTADGRGVVMEQEYEGHTV